MQTPFLARLLTAVRHQWLIVVAIIIAGIGGAILLRLASHPHYAAVTSVLMVAGSSEESTSQEVASATKPLLSSDLPSLATGATVLSRLRADLGETAPLETLRDRIRAKVSPDSTIMPVEYTAKTAEQAINGANALGAEITRLYRELATARFDSLIADFKAQLTARRAELAKLDGSLADVSKTYPYSDVQGVAASSSGGESVYGRLISLRTQRDDLEVTLRADAAGASSTQQLIRNAYTPAMRDVVQTDSVYSRIHDQYAKDEAELTRVSAYGSAGYPGLVELRRTVLREAREVEAARRAAALVGPAGNAAYASALDSQARADGLVASDRAKIAAENAALQQLYSQIGRRSIATNVARMRRDHDNAEAAYTIIAARLAKAIADRAEAASTGSVIVLEPAQYASKSSSGGGQIAAVAVVFLSIWLALTVALMIDSSREWFRDSRTIETIYGAPVIGSVA